MIFPAFLSGFYYHFEASSAWDKEASSSPRGGMETNIAEFQGMSMSAETQASCELWETQKLFFWYSQTPNLKGEAA